MDSSLIQNGNPIACSDGRQFSYDYENRLTKLTSPTAQTDFAYNGFGDRVSKIYNVFHQEKEIEYQKSVDEILGLTRNYNDLPLSRSVTTHQYVYDDLGRQIYEKQTVDSRQTLAYYTYGYGMQARRVNQTNQYLHSDILSSITAITNSSGSAIGTYEYDPYGIMLSSSTNLGNFGFTGQEIDFETNLYHFPARYYEPYWGRFLTPDPIKEKAFYDHLTAAHGGAFMNIFPQLNDINQPQALNVYLYAENNPIYYLDITGLAKVCYMLAYHAGPSHTVKDIDERWSLKDAMTTGPSRPFMLNIVLYCVFEVVTEGTIMRVQHASIDWLCTEDMPCGKRKSYVESTSRTTREVVEEIYKKETRRYEWGRGLSKPMSKEDACWYFIGKIGKKPGWQRSW